MAPSIDCIASLYCAEDVSGSGWDDENEGADYALQVVNDPFHSSSTTTIGATPGLFLDFPVEDEEAISTLLQKEAHSMPEEDYLGRYHARNLNAGARQSAIRWMLKVEPAIIFGVSSMMMLSLASNPFDSVSLLSTGCLSLTYLPSWRSTHHLVRRLLLLLLEFDVQQSSTCSSYYYECYRFDSVWSTLVGV